MCFRKLSAAIWTTEEFTTELFKDSGASLPNLLPQAFVKWESSGMAQGMWLGMAAMYDMYDKPTPTFLYP